MPILLAVTPELMSILAGVREGLLEIQKEIKIQGECMSQSLDDVKSAVAGMNTSVTDELAAISTKLASFTDGASSVELAELKTSIDAVTQRIKDETASLS